ncbi:MAG: serine protein kinase PrkA [Planctomycetota bacterium]
MHLDSFLESIADRCRARFEERRSIKTFHEYLESLVESPRYHLRTAPQYTVDMMDYFGHEEIRRVGLKDRRWKVFDLAFDNPFEALVGQERVQNEIYRYLQQFARRGRSDKMVMLHGPNGSAKTTTVECLFRGLEHYSRQPEGALYRFNWVFSEREDRAAERIGFEFEDGVVPDSYARLAPGDISARVTCELRDPPLFLIPREERKIFLEAVLADHPQLLGDRGLNLDYFVNGDLCTKCRRIFDALLTCNQGEWKQVLRHIQIERYFVSKRYREGAISIEPQGNIDAGARPVSYEPSIHLPAVLQGLSLLEGFGDLIDANHGVVEYSDFLKRPMETNKYLLTTSEKGTIQLQNYTAFLDTVILATANEKQLSLFKRSPDFASFKGRIELIQVPYLLMYSREAKLYQKHIDLFSRGRHVTPHTAEVAALWAVLSRLRRASPKNYPTELAPIVARLTPMEKVKLYDHGQLPLHLRDQERKLLEASIRMIRDEHNETEAEFEGLPGAEYEGRRGASPREMMSLLGGAAANKKFRCLTPMAVFEEIEKLIRDASVYEFLRIPADNGYNDCERFLLDVQQEYLEGVVQEVYESIGLVEESEYERVFENYFHHVKAFDLGEKLYVPSRGEYVEPSEELMGRIEGLLDLHEPVSRFRSNLMTKIAAFSIDHPDEPIRYQELFPQIFSTLKQSYYHERDEVLMRVEQNMLRHGSDEYRFLTKEDQKQVEAALERMTARYHYCEHCAKDVIAFVLRSR